MKAFQSIPKAILYFFDKSIWVSVPELGLIEKGYTSQDYDHKVVDLSESFLDFFLLDVKFTQDLTNFVVQRRERTLGKLMVCSDYDVRESRVSKYICEMFFQPRVLEIESYWNNSSFRCTSVSHSA